jgi:hypothetical protein
MCTLQTDGVRFKWSEGMAQQRVADARPAQHPESRRSCPATPASARTAILQRWQAPPHSCQPPCRPGRAEEVEGDRLGHRHRRGIPPAAESWSELARSRPVRCLASPNAPQCGPFVATTTQLIGSLLLRRLQPPDCKSARKLRRFESFTCHHERRQPLTSGNVGRRRFRRVRRCSGDIRWLLTLAVAHHLP